MIQGRFGNTALPQFPTVLSNLDSHAREPQNKSFARVISPHAEMGFQH